MSRRLAALSIAIAAISLPSTAAHAFCRTKTTSPGDDDPTTVCLHSGAPLWWKSACVGYVVHKDTTVIPFEELKRVVDASFAAWVEASRCDTGQPAPGISATNLGTSSCREIIYHGDKGNQNVVIMRDDVWPHADPDLSLGLSTLTYNSFNGEIFDGDIEINGTKRDLSTSDPVEPGKVDLQAVITHELGHFFGLAHTVSTGTMRKTYDTKTTVSRRLSPDDVAGICAIYPTAKLRAVEFTGSPPLTEATACDTAPRNGLDTECSVENAAGENPNRDENDGCICAVPHSKSSSNGGAAWLAFMAATFMAAARRRARARTRTQT